jgi:hypothetical protein
MTFDLIAHMQAVADHFDGDVTAYVDPAAALANRPCVLVGPPAVDPTEGTVTAAQAIYPVYALSSYPAGTLEAVTELNDLVQAIDDALHYERAVPVRYTLTAAGDPVAAYLCTHTEIEE